MFDPRLFLRRKLYSEEEFIEGSEVLLFVKQCLNGSDEEAELFEAEVLRIFALDADFELATQSQQKALLEGEHGSFVEGGLRHVDKGFRSLANVDSHEDGDGEVVLPLQRLVEVGQEEVRREARHCPVNHGLANVTFALIDYWAPDVVHLGKLKAQRLHEIYC